MYPSLLQNEAIKAGKVEEDFTGETVHFESGPHAGEVVGNVLMTWTIVWLPLTIQSLARAAFLRYRFTDRRISVLSAAPWDNEQVDISYREITDIKTVGRGIGLWGDMLFILESGDKVTIKSVPKFQELKEYVMGRKAALMA